MLQDALLAAVEAVCVCVCVCLCVCVREREREGSRDNQEVTEGL
jgi:hypothetical protein